MNAKWSVLAVYQGAAAREAAMHFCDAMIQRFWPHTSFDVDWHDSKDLQEGAAGSNARGKAERADMILAATPQGGLDPRFRAWLEQALAKRGEREGFLVGLSASEPGASAEGAATQQYLRKLAHQRGLDYLSDVPQSLSHGVPETVEDCTLRARQVTTVLDRILHRPVLPTRMM